MAEMLLKQRALELWNEGVRHHLHNDLESAIALYSESIETCPTAEAYTFRGWAYSASERYDDAIAECQHAIETDPTFGNPYNDIGAYLIAKGDLDSAIGWLERAKQAPRYEPRHYPYMNLGRVYALKGMVRKALEEFGKALEIQPGEETCQRMIAQLGAMLN